MVYLLFVLIALASTLAVVILSSLKGVADTGIKQLQRFYKPQDDIKPFSGIKLILIIIFCFATALAIQISLYKNTMAVDFIKLYVLFVIVLSAALVDYKRKIIPNSFVIFGLLFRVAVCVYEVFNNTEIKTVLLSAAIGFAIGFGFLALVSVITRGAIGFGDAKLFGIIGLTSGSFCTYSTLLISLIFSAVVSLAQIARKKIGKKDSIPFGPCIAVGYIAALLLINY